MECQIPNCNNSSFNELRFHVETKNKLIVMILYYLCSDHQNIFYDLITNDPLFYTHLKQAVDNAARETSKEFKPEI